MVKPILHQTELGLEKQCIACKDFFPLDKEFWWHNGNTRKDGTKGWCAACKGCYNTYYKRHQKTGRKNNTASNWEKL